MGRFFRTALMGAIISCVLTGGRAHAADTLLSDAETPAGWDNATLIDDPRAGAHAVRLAVPAGKAGALVLGLQRVPATFSTDGILSFWYRFSGTGSSNLMIKLQAHPFADGYQAVWEVAPKAAADGQWHLVSLDLGSAFQRWGAAPDTSSRYLLFRTEAPAGSALTLDIDEVRLGGRLFTARVERAIVQGANLRTNIALTNLRDQPVSLNAAGTAIKLGPNETTVATISVSLAPGTLAKLKPLEAASQTIRITAEGDAMATDLIARYAPPMQLPPHPRLLFTAAEVPGIKARAAAHPPLQEFLGKIMGVADGYLTRKVELPNRGSAWGHWYACKKDGARLIKVSPTEHKCPVCGTVYSGWPYDDVPLQNIHMGYARAIQYQGMAYQFTGERKYADKAREILLAYAARYLTYPEHDINNKPGPNGGRVSSQKLDEAVWLIPVVQGADMVWDTLSEADRQVLERDLFRPAVEEIRKQKMGIHNIQNWQNSAVGLTGLLIGEPEFVADAVTSEFGYYQQIAKGVTDEGQWFEGSWGYHFYAMNAMLPLLEAGERCGLGLYRYETNGRSYKRLFEGPLQLAMPNYDLPAFNDSNTVNLLKESNIWEGGSGSLYEVALARYGDPRFAELPSHLARASLEALLLGVFPLPVAPDAVTGSRNYESSGYSVLKQGSGPDASWLCLKYGPHGGGHGHYDKLSFVLYGKGRVLGVDPGTASYGVPIQNEWYRSSLAHNTLTVDETNQKPATGSSLAFLNNGTVSAALADAGPIYDGVRYRRAVALFGTDAVLIVDIADSAAEHQYDFAYHNAGTWLMEPAGEAVTMPPKPGYQHLQGVVRTAQPLPAIATGTAAPVRIAVAAAGPMEVLTGKGPGEQVTDLVPAVIARVHGKSAAVAWLITFGDAAPKVSIQTEGGDYRLTGEAGGKTFKLRVAPEQTVKLQVG